MSYYLETDGLADEFNAMKVKALSTLFLTLLPWKDFANWFAAYCATICRQEH